VRNDEQIQAQQEQERMVEKRMMIDYKQIKTYNASR
jgi:hypothetical protein